MKGDNFVRFCGHCEKNVYNLSALTADAAIDLIRAKEGNLCGRFFRRADGTMLIADCPVGVHHRIRRKRRLAAFAAPLAGLLGLSGCTKLDEPSSTTASAPTQQQQPQVDERQKEVVAIAGGLCPPPELLRQQAAPELLPEPRELESESD